MGTATPSPLVQLPDRCWRLTTTAPGHGGESADLLLCLHFPTREEAVQVGLEHVDGDEITPGHRVAIAAALSDGAEQLPAGCWVLRCGDCGIELRDDEDGHYAVQHLTDPEMARDVAIYRGWTFGRSASGHGGPLCPQCPDLSVDQDGGQDGVGNADGEHDQVEALGDRRPGPGQLVLVEVDGPGR